MNAVYIVVRFICVNEFYLYIKVMKDTILNNYCSAGVYVNVIAIDWSKAAASVDYIQSAANTAVVGQMISCVINRFKTDLNVDPTDN